MAKTKTKGVRGRVGRSILFVYLEDQQHKGMDDARKRRSVSISTWVREAVSEKLARERKP